MTKMYKDEHSEDEILYTRSHLHYVLFVLFLSALYGSPCCCYDPIFPEGSLQFHLMLHDIECFHGIESKRVPDCSMSRESLSSFILNNLKINKIIEIIKMNTKKNST